MGKSWKEMADFEVVFCQAQTLILGRLIHYAQMHRSTSSQNTSLLHQLQLRINTSQVLSFYNLRIDHKDIGLDKTLWSNPFIKGILHLSCWGLRSLQGVFVKCRFAQSYIRNLGWVEFGLSLGRVRVEFESVSGWVWDGFRSGMGQVQVWFRSGSCRVWVKFGLSFNKSRGGFAGLGWVQAGFGPSSKVINILF